MRYSIILLLLLTLISCKGTKDTSVYSPNEVLFEINSQPVTADEFVFSFKKSHQNDDSITRNDIDDYLQLFINYKLKVAEARKAGYDTLKGYLTELETYQEQLKSSYRSSEQILDKLKREAYDRMKQEVHASHILLRLPENPSAEDTLALYQRILEIKEKSRTEDFATLARKFSEDPSVKFNSGDLGYFTAFQMVYSFESAAFETPVGEVSDPVRTEFGYHLLKVHSKKEVSHKKTFDQIFVGAKQKQDTLLARNKIFEVYEMLKRGLSPGQAVEMVESNELEVQVGKMPPMAQLQEAGFQLQVEGEISDPVKTSLGWHILILMHKEQIPSYAEYEDRLSRMVRRTDRMKVYENQLMDELYEKYNLEMKIGYSEIYNTYKIQNDSIPLFNLDNKIFTLGNFKKYIKVNGSSSVSTENVERQYKTFIDNQVRSIEDEYIVENNPELKWLLKEYEEGILLFNIMEDTVWNKAVKDKEGMEKFLLEKKDRTIANDDSTLEDSQSNDIIEYQEYLEQHWIRRLKEEYDIKISQPSLNKLYEKLLD